LLSQHSGMVAYIIKRKGMEKILNTVGYPFKISPTANNKNIDDIISTTNPYKQKIITTKKPSFFNWPYSGVSDVFILDLVNTYAITPLVFLINNTDLESTIHKDHMDGHITIALDGIKNFKKISDEEITRIVNNL